MIKKQIIIKENRQKKKTEGRKSCKIRRNSRKSKTNENTRDKEENYTVDDYEGKGKEMKGEPRTVTQKKTEGKWEKQRGQVRKGKGERSVKEEKDTKAIKGEKNEDK